eukprot:7719407-Lingulodinium_polyedra.AAC.1
MSEEPRARPWPQSACPAAPRDARTVVAQPPQRSPRSPFHHGPLSTRLAQPDASAQHRSAVMRWYQRADR